MRCCIETCESYYADRTPLKVSFFGFPSEPDLQKKWLEIINQKDLVPTRNVKVCSLHFRPEEILKVCKGYRLVHGAVPSLSNGVDPIKIEIEDFEELDTSFEVAPELSMPPIEIKEEFPITGSTVALPLPHTQNLIPAQIIKGGLPGSGARTLLVQHLTLVRSQASQTDIVGNFTSNNITQVFHQNPLPTLVQTLPTAVQKLPTAVQTIPTNVQTLPAPVQMLPAPVQTLPAPVQTLPAPVQAKITSDYLKSTPRICLKDAMEPTPVVSLETSPEIKKLLCTIEVLKKNVKKKDVLIKTLNQRVRRNRAKIENLTTLLSQAQNKV